MNMQNNAGSTDTHESDTQQLQLVTFQLGEEEFAIDILSVQEIIRMMQITRVPQSPPEVEGVVNLRGQITPVVDLRKRFGMESLAHGADARIIVVEVQGRVLGFVVDQVNEVLRIDRSIVDPAPTLAASSHSDYVRGVGKLNDRLLILLDLVRLFAAEPGACADGLPVAA
jgi:purine-binding chemotaxis protein CheW